MTEDMEPPEVTVQLADRLKVTVTGASGDDLEDVTDAASDQLREAVNGIATVQDITTTDVNGNEPGIQ